MSQNTKPSALDRSDERVRHDDTIGGAIRAFFDRVKAGDLGVLPVVIGLVVISVVFTSLNPVFLAPNNLVNLLFDCATVGVISLGIVCVLLLGEIDLSAGSVSGFAAAVVGVVWINMGWPVAAAIFFAILAGAAVGMIYSFLFNKIGMPSFIISHNMEDVRAVADRIVVLRLGKNNGVFTPESSNHELIAAITGASENSVSRRQDRKAAEAQTQEQGA